MPKQSFRKPRTGDIRPKRQILLFFVVLILSSGLMYLDVALRFSP